MRCIKYIRMKDKVYIANCDVFDQFGKKWYWVGGDEKAICVENVIKATDAIEELCDEFICVRKRDDEHYNTKDKKIFDYWLLEKEYINCDWFGAIWTDKGLIYVAKLNEKGEFELL